LKARKGKAAGRTGPLSCRLLPRVLHLPPARRPLCLGEGLQR